MTSVAIPQFRSKEYRKILQEINEAFVFSAEAKKEREDLARKAYKAYRTYIDEKKYPFPTKSNIGKFTSDVRVSVAAELDSLLQAPPLLRFYPRGASSQQQATWMEALCSYYLDQMPLRAELDDALTQLRLFGTVYGHAHWRLEMRNIGAWERVIKEEPMFDESGLPMLNPDGTPMTTPVETREYTEGERQVYAGPWFSTLHFTEVYPDHLEKYLQDGAFFIHRTMRDRRWLRERAKQGIYDKKAVDRMLNNEEGTSSPWEDFASLNTGTRLENTVKWQQEIGLGTLVSWADVESRRWFEIIEYWAADGVVTTIGNGSYILRRRRNPFAHGLFPFVMARNIHVPGEHYGMSDWEVAGRLYQAHNDMHNIALTQAHLSAFPPIKRTQDVDERQLRQRGLRDIWVIKSPESELGFVPLPQEGIQVGQAMTADLGQAIDTLVGASEAMRGGISDASATSITTAINQGSIRLGYHLGNVGEMLRDLGTQYQEMIRQNQVHDLTVRIIGDPQANPMTIPIDEMRDADLICSPTYSTSKLRMLEEKRSMELYELIVRTQEPNADRRGAFTAIVETVAPQRKNQYLKSEEQMQQEALAAQEAMVAEEQAQMAKMQEAQQYAAAAGRQTAQTESVVRGAQAQGRPIVEFARIPDDLESPEVAEMGSEFAEMTEALL